MSRKFFFFKILQKYSDIRSKMTLSFFLEKIHWNVLWRNVKIDFERDGSQMLVSLESVRPHFVGRLHGNGRPFPLEEKYTWVKLRVCYVEWATEYPRGSHQQMDWKCRMTKEHGTWVSPRANSPGLIASLRVSVITESFPLEWIDRWPADKKE